MSNDLVTVSDMQTMASAVVSSGLFGIKTKEQALTLMLISQAEGRHPALAARDYDIIQNKPAKKAEAMMRDFLQSGGKVEWHALTDALADATFSHPQGGSVRISWDMDRAKIAGLVGKDNWKKHPRQMLRSRVVSEGVRTVCPMATSGMEVPEEVQDTEHRDIAPPKKVESLEAQFTEVVEQQQPENDLKKQAKEFADAMETADSMKALEKLIADKKSVTERLEKELPAWHEKLQGKIADRRSFLATPEPPPAEPDNLEPPEFLKRRRLEAAE